MNYDAVIFDLDGTLCDTLPDIHRSVNLTLAALGCPEREFSHTALGINRGSRHLIDVCLAAHEHPDDTQTRFVTERLKDNKRAAHDSASVYFFAGCWS